MWAAMSSFRFLGSLRADSPQHPHYSETPPWAQRTMSIPSEICVCQGPCPSGEGKPLWEEGPQGPGLNKATSFLGFLRLPQVIWDPVASLSCSGQKDGRGRLGLTAPSGHPPPGEPSQGPRANCFPTSLFPHAPATCSPARVSEVFGSSVTLTPTSTPSLSQVFVRTLLEASDRTPTQVSLRTKGTFFGSHIWAQLFHTQLGPGDRDDLALLPFHPVPSFVSLALTRSALSTGPTVQPCPCTATFQGGQDGHQLGSANSANTAEALSFPTHPARI